MCRSLTLLVWFSLGEVPQIISLVGAVFVVSGVAIIVSDTRQEKS